MFSKVSKQDLFVYLFIISIIAILIKPIIPFIAMSVVCGTMAFLYEWKLKNRKDEGIKELIFKANERLAAFEQKYEAVIIEQQKSMESIKMKMNAQNMLKQVVEPRLHF